MKFVFALACVTVCDCVGFERAPKTLLVPDSRVKVVIIISNEFNFIERQQIVAGAEMWKDALDGFFEFYVSFPSDKIEVPTKMSMTARCTQIVVFYPILSSSEYIKSADKRHKKRILGIARPNNCGYTPAYLVVDRLQTSFDIRLIAAHELGHAMGLDHTFNKESVMAESYSHDAVAGCITRDDVENFCSEYWCNAKRMKFCEQKLAQR